MAFTFTSFICLPLNFYTSISGCNFDFGFDKNIGGSTDLAKKKARIGGFVYTICIPLLLLRSFAKRIAGYTAQFGSLGINNEGLDTKFIPS